MHDPMGNAFTATRRDAEASRVDVLHRGEEDKGIVNPRAGPGRRSGRTKEVWANIP